MGERRFWSLCFFFLLLCTRVVAAGADEVPGPVVGDSLRLPFAVADQSGDERTLGELMGENGVALFFVRSADWCPFCQRQLVEVNERLDEFEALGLSAVSVSVDDVAAIRSFAEARGIRYTMLADPEGAINMTLGIRDEQYPVGSAAYGVPRPTLYVIDRSGTIRARYMEPTYRTRPDLDVVLRDAAALSW